ncbi:hypothetical protein [Synechococcus sp. PCC 6312]|uniref:hypothetical protein n=1 Tax=Synechococcus sp. (strain ATCC 27167 / PCC 6312) TaxID=195253 RepID=UPI00029F2288|nr:hypothetical protein [Synechococcus sp. PCC 6312]AFY62571.1 CemA family [Synechococcus sp. PCC 6312]
MWQRWLQQWQLSSLEKAYQGAIALKDIEDKHFQGQAVSFDPQLGKAASAYLQSKVEQQLNVIEFNLSQFQLTGRFKNLQNDPQETEILAKLAFIESVASKYHNLAPVFTKSGLKSTKPSANNALITDPITNSGEIVALTTDSRKPPQSSLLIGNFIDTANQIRRELNPDYEQEVVQDLRILRRQQATAIRWLLILVIVPLVVQITTRNLIFEPLLDGWWNRNPNPAEISQEVGEHFRREFFEYKEKLEIGEILGLVPASSTDQMRARLKEKAEELYRQAGYRTLDGLKNIFADIISLASFVLLVYGGRRQLQALRMFFGRTFTSLNDTTKVFLVILVTDLFVGYHSPEGWEVILGGIASHFGLPESRTFNNSFIATVPVIMDSWFKFWVFNYLTRTSPSSVAILEKMNQ